MGCWDIYCFICGNPCHSFTNFTIDEIKGTIKNDYLKKILAPIKDTKPLIDDLIKLIKNTLWMEKCTMLLQNNKIVHGVKETNCNINFYKKNFQSLQIGYEKDECLYGNISGIFLHTDCWKYIKNEYNIELKFSILPPFKINKNKVYNIDYGDIEKYWNQFFSFLDVVIANKTYLCSSPLKNDKNITQIKKNISYLKLKNDPKRQGPSISATFYQTGNIKIGNNKRFWIIKNNKWTEMQGIPYKMHIIMKTLTSKQQKMILKTPFIGSYSKDPIFINSIKYKKKCHYIEFILLEEMKRQNLQILDI